MQLRRVAVLIPVFATFAIAAYLPASAAGKESYLANFRAPAVKGVTYRNPDKLETTTPIKHIVVLFQENISFDHYFGTYPHAANLPGETKWTAAKGHAQCQRPGPGPAHPQPKRVQSGSAQCQKALTCDQDHDYTPEQKAEDGGLMDKFVQNTTGTAGSTYEYCPQDIAMGYYDGNVATALWNYAQHFVLSDNTWDTEFGPSTPGAVNLISGDTGTALCGPASAVINAPVCTSTPPSASGTPGTNYSDADPYYDACSNSFNPTPASDIALSGPNIGTMLDTKGVSWGWFQGGFGDCMSKSPPKDGPVIGLTAQGATVAQDPNDQTTDYSPHHEPFEYYASTANPMHLPPTSVATVGKQDQANHQYDLSWFWKAADAGNLPAVSFLKAPRYEDGHAGYSDPLDEQYYLVQTINRLEKLPTWKSTAVIITWDDSDGWYDHQFGPIVNQSNASIDDGLCGTTPSGAQPGRCGYGPRLPLLVISPYAKSNYVDNDITDQRPSLSSSRTTGWAVSESAPSPLTTGPDRWTTPLTSTVRSTRSSS